MTDALDKIFVQEDRLGIKQENIPAIDARWMEKREFLHYQPPPLDAEDHGSLEEWLDRLKFIEEDLHWLLQLPHDKFWCQRIFDESLHKLIDSYLKYTPRWYDVLHHVPVAAVDRHNEVHRLMFMTCLRTATYKESKEHHLTPEVFGEIIYNNFLFDVPKLLDLCVLYTPGNTALLSKMVENIFTQQPKYNDDLMATIPALFHVFRSVEEKCGIRDSANQSPQKLSAPPRGKSDLVSMETGELQDVIFYLCDIGMTLVAFLEVYPPACELFLNMDFIQNLASWYDRVIPEVGQAVKKRTCENSSLKRMLKKQLHRTKTSLLKIVHLIINHCFLCPVLEDRNVEEKVEGFIQTFSSLLNERKFLADFESKHRFSEYMDILNNGTVLIDETRIEYLQDAVKSAFATYGTRRKPAGGPNRGGRTSPDGSPSPVDSMMGAVGGVALCGAMGGALDYDAEVYEMGGATAAKKSGVELDSLIMSVKDLLPDLGEGFIELCLEEMNYDLEKVIHGILEDKLPLSLQELDRNMPRERADNPVSDVGTGSLLEERKNIFDGDEFDVYTRDVIDTSRVHKGKRNKTNQRSLTADDPDMGAVKARMIDKYSVLVEEREVKDGEDDGDQIYDDEYDDTYDTNNIGANDADIDDEYLNRQFTVPRVFRTEFVHSGSESDHEDEEEQKTQHPPRDEFVPNPALIRQRAEERAAWKAQRRGQGQQRHRQQRPPTEGQDDIKNRYDVKGKPKGQGQDDNVLKNRRWKEKNKGRGANHNRRFMSDRKRLA